MVNSKIQQEKLNIPVIRLVGEEALVNLKEALKCIDSAIGSNVVNISFPNKYTNSWLFLTVHKHANKAMKYLKLTQSELKVFEEELGKYYNEITFSTTDFIFACSFVFNNRTSLAVIQLRLEEVKREIEKMIFDVERTLDNLNEN